MTEQEYMDQRLKGQMKWYGDKSTWNKKWFLRLKVAETILALFIPLLTGYITTGNGATSLKLTIGLIGIIVAAMANLITLFKFQENWISYRAVSESLKYEQYLYLAKAGPYKEPSFPVFAERIEGIISKENSQWTAYVKSKGEESKNG